MARRASTGYVEVLKNRVKEQWDRKEADLKRKKEETVAQRRAQREREEENTRGRG
jgi:hypothetical protein